MSWNIKTPGDYINGPLTVAGQAAFLSSVGIHTASPLGGSDAGLTVGALGTVRSINVGMQNTIARLREKDAVDAFAITTNITSGNAQDDVTKSSWKLRMGFGNGNDNFLLSRSAPGSVSFNDILMASAGGVARLIVFGSGDQVDETATFAVGQNSAGAIRLYAGVNNTNELAYIGTVKTGIAYRPLHLQPNGSNVLIGNGVVNNGAGGCLQLKSGITFPATAVGAADANTLDDYEEGTFTPTINGSTVVGTATYNGRSGRYTKIGNQVHVQIFIDWTGHTGTGDMRIAGLPFQNGANFSAASIGYSNAVASSAGFVITGYAEASQSYIQMSQFPTGGGTATALPMDAAGVLLINASYQI